MMISLLVPTRARPIFMKRLWESAVETAADPARLEVVFYLDSDDTEGIDCYNALKSGRVKAVIGPRILLSEAWNVCYRASAKEICMHCGDDLIFRSQDWDRYIRDAFQAVPDKILFVYGRDGIQDQKLGTHGFLHRNWVEMVGYFVPPYFASDYNDLWLTDIAKRIKRARFLPEVFTEHMHPLVGKAELDVNHQERLRRHHRENVDLVYKSLKAKRKDDAKKLKAFINAYSKLK